MILNNFSDFWAMRMRIEPVSYSGSTKFNNLLNSNEAVSFCPNRFHLSKLPNLELCNSDTLWIKLSSKCLSSNSLIAKVIFESLFLTGKSNVLNYSSTQFIILVDFRVFAKQFADSALPPPINQFPQWFPAECQSFQILGSGKLFVSSTKKSPGLESIPSIVLINALYPNSSSYFVVFFRFLTKKLSFKTTGKLLVFSRYPKLIPNLFHRTFGPFLDSDR